MGPHHWDKAHNPLALTKGPDRAATWRTRGAQAAGSQGASAARGCAGAPSTRDARFPAPRRPRPSIARSRRDPPPASPRRHHGVVTLPDTRGAASPFAMHSHRMQSPCGGQPWLSCCCHDMLWACVSPKVCRSLLDGRHPRFLPPSRIRSKSYKVRIAGESPCRRRIPLVRRWPEACSRQHPLVFRLQICHKISLKAYNRLERKAGTRISRGAAREGTSVQAVGQVRHRLAVRDKP